MWQCASGLSQAQLSSQTYLDNDLRALLLG